MKYSLRSLMSGPVRKLILVVIFLILFLVSSALINYCMRKMGIEDAFEDANMFGSVPPSHAPKNE